MSSGFAVLARADENKVGADRIAEQAIRRNLHLMMLTTFGRPTARAAPVSQACRIRMIGRLTSPLPGRM